MARLPVLCHVRSRYDEVTRRDAFFIRSAHHFAFVSNDSRRHFAVRVPEQRSTVLYDGIDIADDAELAGSPEAASAVREEFGLPHDAVIAAMFARVAPAKDYPTLVRAAKLLAPAYPRLRFMIVGDHLGPKYEAHYQEVRAALAEAGMEERFVFTGFRADTERLMLAADLGVLSTHTEGLPLVLLEHMALARPVVATAVGGIPEVVDDGATGWLYPLRDAPALADRIARVLDDPAAARQMGRAGREEVRRRFSRYRFAQELHALYARLLGWPAGHERLAQQ
jgi:glycosyltransferase involved in cell wall biosynthesis